MQRLLSSVAVLWLCWSRWLFELCFDQWIILPLNCLPCLKLERKYDWNGSKLTDTGSGVTSSVWQLKMAGLDGGPTCLCLKANYMMKQHTRICACNLKWLTLNLTIFLGFLGVLYLSILYFFSTICRIQCCQLVLWLCCYISVFCKRHM